MQKMLVAALGATTDAAVESTPRRSGRAGGSSARLKRGFDIGAVSLALLFFFPLLLVVMAVVFIAQGRPIFIRHRRVGRDGALFPCLKFRTMVVDGDRVLKAHIASDANAASEWQATRKLKNDPRVTPLGHVMRKLSVDELPQLVNVLRGEMSLVGPRPIVLDEVHHYGSAIQLYQSVRPGLTGSWQIGGRNDVSYARRVEMDADYVANQSFRRDLSILIKTVPAVMASRGCY